MLPRSIIELSPFHTSLFVTNLASINTPCIFHHCYEFGTTSVFVCMGRPVPDPLAPEGVRKKIMPMSVVMDERIATGIEYSRFSRSCSEISSTRKVWKSPSTVCWQKKRR